MTVEDRDTASAAREQQLATVAITAVIVNYGTAELTLNCLAALSREREMLPNLDVIVVDGGSVDGSADRLAAALVAEDLASWTGLVAMQFNGGFGWANNQAIRRALSRSKPPEFIYIVNPDAQIEPGALVKLVEALNGQPCAASAGSRLVTPDGQLLGSAFRFLTVRREFLRGANTPLIEKLIGAPSLVIDGEEEVAAEWVTGASVLLRAEALRQCGLFDEGFFLYFEEVELMHRLARGGWGARYVPESRVRHIGGASTGVADGVSAQRRLPDYWFRSRRRFFALAYGPSAARLSALAWIAGYAIWRLRQFAGMGRASAHAPGEFADLRRNGLGPTPFDHYPAIGRWDGPWDEPPAWVAHT
ncbi:glycosyltransferase family 2 protein [Sphingomonas sp. KR1UV-12]|uniref:Glycosyltransferase family 2 protein n=1 Tax=Sphingomonas aurea TaxID=3063994 RepID=A0ABT9EG32_9SPHN|nr:glycosyltransferase family 2 protein [Sphingomonas sp. KR1UV-12]MDP1025583.1 glycosyltransferase family 2 protein [Sphingomonas sp. KR1UV-12]